MRCELVTKFFCSHMLKYLSSLSPLPYPQQVTRTVVVLSTLNTLSFFCRILAGSHPYPAGIISVVSPYTQNKITTFTWHLASLAVDSNVPTQSHTHVGHISSQLQPHHVAPAPSRPCAFYTFLPFPMPIPSLKNLVNPIAIM